MTVQDTRRDTGPAEDWYCRCTEPSPDRIGVVKVLRPSSRRHCHLCGEYAPWTWERAEYETWLAGLESGA